LARKVSVTAVDTNVLLDIWLNDPEFASTSKNALQIALSEGDVIVAPVVVAELAAAIDAPEHIVNVLEQMSVAVSQSSWEELVLAGRLWSDRRGSRRERIIADFLIAANAAIAADRLLTRDKDFARLGIAGLAVATPQEMASST
jgi:predicted nucleic acid-binding protein